VTDIIKLPQELKIFNAAELEHKQSPNFSRIYTNSAGFGVNFFDLTIMFGEMVQDPGGMHIEDRVAVTMSLEHANALAQALRQAIDLYETSHAPIRKTPGPIPQV
jgi:hypothetical protein